MPVTVKIQLTRLHPDLKLPQSKNKSSLSQSFLAILTTAPQNFKALNLKMSIYFLKKKISPKSGLVWGFSFLQYCWEDELIFYYEKCQDDKGYKCFEECKNGETGAANDVFSYASNFASNDSSNFESSPFYLDCVAKACYFCMIVNQR